MASKSEYVQAIYNLMPYGVAWTREGSNCLVQDYIESISEQLANADVQVDLVLSEEAIASKTTYRLNDWLDEWGLPDECMTALGQYDFPIDKLQQALSAKVSTWGLDFKQALEQIAKRFGYTAEVSRYEPYTVVSQVNKHMYDYTYSNSINVITNTNNNTESFNMTWSVDQPLARYNDRVYECLVRQIIPAHLVTVFTYPQN